ncbi:MAG: hypothetical protein M3R52_02420 [Acidobacteriota bacterium]|nr:hypothetical protein [Acidobacteriota bacterium]
MHKALNLVSSSAVLIALITVCVATASAQEPGLVGSWQTKDSELVMRVTFNPDGTGVLDSAPIKYSVRGDKLMVNEEGTINNYTFKLSGDVLVVAGGNLESPLTFVRQTNAKGFGKRKADATDEQKEPKPKEQGIVGRWQSSEATVQINEDGTLNLNGATYRYAVKGNNITLANNDGALTFPFQLSGDTLQVLVDGRLVTYKRLTGGAGLENAGSVSGSNPRELFGKWCYMSNVNSSGGGRMSNSCFTLYENGTYGYYSETSSSGPVASSASQESDSGTWSVSGGALTANSRARGTLRFTLEKRNHPKTGDPMLVLDGDAFVTYSQRSPWP